MSAADREKWNAKYAAETPPREPSAVLVGLADWLPKRGAALDLAGGGGRHAIWLAQRGLEVTLADISHVALDIAWQRAAEAGVTIQTMEADPTWSRHSCLPKRGRHMPSRWDLIVTRLLFAAAVVCRLSAACSRRAARWRSCSRRETNLQRHPKPPRDYLLDDGELPQPRERSDGCLL